MLVTDLSDSSLLEYAGTEHVEGDNSQLTYPTITAIEPEMVNNSRPTYPNFIISLHSAPAPLPLGASSYISSREKYTATGRSKDTEREIKQLAQTAGEDNWDGEGANKLSMETIEVALKLVATFPSDVLGDDLDIDATPFGSIDFGWVLERDVMMNVIVLPSGEIGFAYSVHGERDDGKELWKGTLPNRISEAFDRVFYREGLDG